MKCQQCENGDHDNCGMQTWCDCDCEGYQQYVPFDHHIAGDLDGERFVKNDNTNKQKQVDDNQLTQLPRQFTTTGGEDGQLDQQNAVLAWVPPLVDAWWLV